MIPRSFPDLRGDISLARHGELNVDENGFLVASSTSEAVTARDAEGLPNPQLSRAGSSGPRCKRAQDRWAMASEGGTGIW